MCNFISWKIESGVEGLKHIFAASLNCHDEVSGHGYEVEWTTDELTIRVPGNVSDHIADELKTAVMAQFKTRDALILHAAHEVIAGGHLPAVWPWTTTKWNDRTKRLFACDVAEHVEQFYTSEGGWKPADTINVARRFANGDAEQDELATAEAAAWDAARVAARDAAYAARDAAYAARVAALAAAEATARAAAYAALAAAYAARDAAYAAWDAALAAAEATARAAAYAALAAARDAEEQWQSKKLLEYITE